MTPRTLHRWIYAISWLFLVLGFAGALTGCAPLSIRTELEHVSHPGAGWPVGPCSEEDALTQANVLAHWQKGDWYADAGLGYNLERSSGFYGPRITGTVRAGREWRLAQ